MSYGFQMLVDVDVSLDDAEPLCNSIISEFQRYGLIVLDPKSDCVPGHIGYPPHLDVFDLYDLQATENYLTIRNSGVEPIVKRSFNYWALGRLCIGFRCPKCRREIPWHHQIFRKNLISAIDAWLKNSEPTNAECPNCECQVPVTHWYAWPPLGLGNLAFRFWNWPPFDSPRWLIDIPALVRQLTGHTIIETCGQI